MTSPILDRQEQAHGELGRTAIGLPTAAMLVFAFLFTLLAVPMIDALGFLTKAHRKEALVEVRSGLTSVAEAGPKGYNLRLQAALRSVERRLAEHSVLRQRGMPLFQWILTRGLGTGNEQAYLGRGEWLFYRADLEHVTGTGFLEPARLDQRRKSGDPWKTRIQPDPLPALEQLDRDLAKRGIRLVLLPIPVKPAIHPDRFTSRMVSSAGALRNPSFPEFVARLRRAGIELIDVAPVLAADSAHGPQFLERDTHWTPAAVERVAELVAERVADYLRPEERAAATALEFSRRPARVSGEGDIAKMLRLPQWASYRRQSVEVHRVLVDGLAWHADPEAVVLLLGDSFTRIYSDPALPWGTGAGLAEQLSYSLRQPIDCLTGNPHWALEAAPERLERKTLLVYEFTARDLSHGSWPLTRLPQPAP
jgi:alginate O-acetyltransferase complex protein AlgJ